MNTNLTKDEIDFIKNLSHEMKTQDNRGTAQPYALVIGNKQRINIDWENRDETAINWNECNYDTLEEFKGAIEEYYEDDTHAGIIEIKRCEDIDDLRNAEYKINTLIDEHISTYAYQIESVYDPNHHCLGNFFITEDAARKYIEENRHNLGIAPHTYGIHLYRNPQMEQLYKIIHKMAEQLQKDTNGKINPTN